MVECLHLFTAYPDCDGDGYDNKAEGSFPLCFNGPNDDLQDDVVVDDGCPYESQEYEPQQGSYSEAQFKIGTDRFGRCGPGPESGPSNHWPSDLVSGGMPTSTDKITLVDLTSFMAPVYRLNTSPGNPGFNRRWDLVPGRGPFTNWIVVNDMTALTAGSSGYPPMFGGAGAWNGPSCTAHPSYGD